MRRDRRAGRRLAERAGAIGAALAAAFPAVALGQARTLGDRVPPGGLSSAWPLGIIVLMVAAMTLLGAWVAHRRRGGRPPRA